jgi:hypothetical protein
VKDGYCTTHHPTEGQDMRELGRRGGRVSPQTRLRKAADDELREQAREVLSKSLRGEKVDPQALAAAKSLFSYRASEAPRQSAHAEHDGRRMSVSLEDLFEVAAESKMFSQMGALDADSEKQMLERLRRRPNRQVEAAAEAIVPAPTPSQQVERQHDSTVPPASAASNDFEALDSPDLDDFGASTSNFA